LYDATGGAVNIYWQEKIKNIAAYIYKVHIGGRYYVNFADASPRVSVPAALLTRAGRDVGDTELVNFAGWLMNNGYAGRQYECVDSKIYRILKNITEHEQNTALKGHITAPAGNWFDGIQVMTARDAAGSHGGFFVAAKGGNNAESHNHNDIGSFILYKDSVPVIIDAGVETYTKKTFSSQRYEIWTMQSCYHNLPRINGADQMSGREARADCVHYTDDGAAAELSMELKAAYPAEARINTYRRQFVFERGKGLTLTDKYELADCTEPIVMNLLCGEEPICGRDGEVKLSGGVTLSYEGGVFSTAVDEISLTDPKLLEEWGVRALYRLRLTRTGMEKTGEFTLRFS
jgi:hypothetical protein